MVPPPPPISTAQSDWLMWQFLYWASLPQTLGASLITPLQTYLAHLPPRDFQGLAFRGIHSNS